MAAENPELLIRKLIRDTIHRAIRESVACVVVLAAFGAILHICETGSPRYYGCLLILVSAGFIAGVVWSHALSYRLLRDHSSSDTAFWREAFYSQSRLLRLVPLWYLAPISSGILLFSAPYEPFKASWFLVMLLLTTVMFSVITWLNRAAAAQIESQAAQLG